jgi:glycine dehydrogenase subunit 2
VPECLLIEPSETESNETLDAFVEACIKINDKAYSQPDLVKGAPNTQPVRKLNDASKLPENWI